MDDVSSQDSNIGLWFILGATSNIQYFKDSLEILTKSIVSLPGTMLNLSLIIFSGLTIGAGSDSRWISSLTRSDSNGTFSLCFFLLTI